MTVFDEAIVAGPAAAEGICVSCPFREAGPRVLGLEYARERARAEAAEARCEELRRAEVEARSVAGSLKWRLDKCRGELKAAGDEVKSVRRMAKNALALQAEVSRLEKLLSQAGVESGKRSTIMSLREENARLKKDVRAAKDRVGRIKLLERETGDLRFWLRGSHERLERIEARHRDEVDWLNKDIACLRSALGRSVDKRNGEMASLRKRNALLRAEVQASQAGMTALASQAGTLEARLAKLRASRAVLSKTMFGRKSERRKKPRSERKRGRQPGSTGHGRTRRRGLEERTERRDPPKDACVCSYCGKPYAANGERSTTVVEIEVKAYTRKIVRPRRRRSCGCASSPFEVTAPPPARLFDNTTMLAMHKDGLIALPPPKWRQGRPKPIVFGPDTEPPLFPPPSTLDEVRPLDFRTVMRGTREGRLWNEFVARYHYLGYKTLVGAQMRYAVHGRDGWPVAMLGFSTAAWKLAPRDRFIGWTPKLREKNLPLVVDNPRFLILPWIEIPNLGSHILSLVRRRLPEDWTARYNTAPVLIETFVETPRYTGAVYKASGWIPVGTTQGRGRYDRDKLHGKPRKDIWLRPLRKNWKQTLNR